MWGFSNISSGVSKGLQGTQDGSELGPCEPGKRFLMGLLTAVPQSNMVSQSSYRTEYLSGIYKQNLPRAHRDSIPVNQPYGVGGGGSTGTAWSTQPK